MFASSAGGERLLLQRARPAIVLRLVGMYAAGLALFVCVPGVVAVLQGEHAFGAALGVVGCVPLAVALLRRRATPVADPRRVEALVAVAIAFTLASFLAVPAFMVAGLAPVDAIFEAVSAVTTTGLTTAATIETLPYSVHFLRFWLQWVGGFAFAAMIIALIAGPGVVALRLGMVEGPGKTLLGSAQSRARSVLGAYLALSVVAVTGAALLAEKPAEGALLALAAISTGGFAVADDNIAGTGPGLQAVVMVTILAGAVSMTLLAQAWRSGIGKFLSDPELRLLVLMSALGGAGIVAIEAGRPEGASAWDSIFTAVSAQSTAGFSTVAISQLAPGSILLLILLMMIGGSLGSTAGGLKLFRFAFACSAIALTTRRSATSPNAVSVLRVFGRKSDPIEATDIFSFILLYFIFVAGLWFAFVLLGHDPLRSLFDTVSAFSTVGLSAGVIGHDLPSGMKLAVAAAMMLGRLEFLAVIALVSPRTWAG